MVKVFFFGDEGIGVLKIYVGKCGLMYSIKDIFYFLVFVLLVIYMGENLFYEFVICYFIFYV